MGKRARKAKGRRGATTGADVAGALPELSTLTDVPAFDQLVCTEAQRRAFDGACGELVAEGVDAGELSLGCVVRLDRGFPAVACADGLARAEFSARLTKGDDSKVAVGDWVCVRRPAGHDMALIEKILPRESDVARWRGGARGERQTLAANVNLTVVVQPVGARGVSVDRISRSAVIARDCGTGVAVLLTKADRVDAAELADEVARVREVLGDEASIVVTSAVGEMAGGEVPADVREALAGTGVLWDTAGVRQVVGPGVVAIVLGESGAGKSTIINALLGREVLETQGVRAADDAGRHTTVTRRMVALLGGGIIVDLPGLRSLPLVGHERGLAKVFPEIAEAASGCRFRDCTHTHEPGCGVREAYAEGAFSKARLDVYLALAGEMRAGAASLDPDVVL